MKNYLYFTVFASGLTTLALELSASRLLGSVFGTSNLVWASIIGLILIYLAVGYFLGGWLADRYPYYKTMFSILAWGAFSAGLVPSVSRPVLRLAAEAFDQLQVGILFGSFSAVLVLFCIPVILLGTISPFAIRLAMTDTSEAGRVSGRIYAVSTLGSFIGTFLPVLVLYTGVMKHYWPAMQALRECRMPVVVAVNGVAAGGGFSLAMSGDIILAARPASFIQVFSRIGLVPDLGSTWLLPRLIGRQRALELMLLNEPLSAERAKEWGLVRDVVVDARLLDEAKALRRPPRRRPDARAGRDAAAARGERARKLGRSVPPRNRTAAGDPRKR